MSYMDDLTIDMFNLELECSKQPSIFMTWAEQYAQAVYDRDKSKQHLKVVTAKTNLAIRQSPQSYGIEKITEAAVQAALDLNSEVLAAEDNYLEAVKNAEIMRGARDSFDDRKKQLTNLVSLQNAKYYSDPTKAHAATLAQEMR